MTAIEENLLSLTQKPARYIGREWNSIAKGPQSVDCTWVLCFPDIYDVGMSHLGLRVLYHILNERDDVACERAFLPWPDYAELLSARGEPLCSLENGLPLSEFDVIGFSLQYEVAYPSVLRMLKLGGLEVRAARRKDGDPLVIGGGPCAFNPEPVAAFFDAFVLGDGEEAVLDITDAALAARKEGLAREQTLWALADIPGVYVPSLYEPEFDGAGRLRAVAPKAGAPEVVERRFVRDLDAAAFPTAPIVPFVETVHDRVVIEITRGCTQGCRFCHAGMTCRPTRARRPETVVRLARESIDSTGYDEVGLLSLSAADYPNVEPLVDALLETFEGEHVNLSLPSQRADAFSVGLCEKISRVRKSGITLAPEAGTQRLRDAINKRVTDEDILSAARAAFAAGYYLIKMYFMIGLPTETEEDIQGIAQTLRQVQRLAEEMNVKRRGVLANVSLATFVPKPHTPFQWDRQLSVSEVRERQGLLAAQVRPKLFKLRWHEAEQSFIEGVLSRGDRRLAAAIERIADASWGPEAWSEFFQIESWMAAFAAEGIDPTEHTRERGEDEALPWQHLSCGVEAQYLLRERQRALQGVQTPDCRDGQCQGCGGFCGHAD